MKPKLPKAKAPQTNKENAGDNRAVEDIYQKKTQLEHILLR